ncbi:vomeronasal type-2 receptor 26-like [Anomaloglossus baeobatrachus]|uniref:vomeronasal type-2 receptor 26-like n=1 Tax=Anomaloglossus baeobatrachus TaxID=238106 RepID=UPI003F4F64A4
MAESGTPRETILHPDAKIYTELLTLIYAVNEVNQNPNLLPNTTLGYLVFDTCGDKMTYFQKILDILSCEKNDVPNYSCNHPGYIAGFIRENFEPTEVLNLYNHPKISYGSSNLMKVNTNSLTNYFTFFQNENFWSAAISSLLQYFEWNFVGVIISQDDSGSEESGLWQLRKKLSSDGICIEFVLKISKEKLEEQQNVIQRSKSEVVIIYSQFSYSLLSLLHTDVIHQKLTLIFNESWFTNFHLLNFFFKATNCSFIFFPHFNSVPGLEIFLRDVNLIDRPNDPLLEDIYFFHGNCSLPNIFKLQMLQLFFKMPLKNCTDKKHHVRLLDFHWNHSSYHAIYTAVSILAHALHNMNLYLKLNFTSSRSKDYSHLMKHFVKKINYLDHNGDKISFTKERVLYGNYSQEILNLIMKGLEINFKKVGDYYHEEEKFHFHNKNIIWKNNRRPFSRCNEKCSPGSRRAPIYGHHFCCYDCVSCSNGEMSQVPDSEICHRCPDDKWPDEKKVKCIPKTYEFLSYEDEIVIIVIFTSILLSTLTIFVLRLFIHYWETPIVKSNNRTVSFILLVSILLSFLCIFLFLGPPMDITCMLRQTIFGTFLSISVSSILSKTITVCIAFKATKPDSCWRNWIGLKTSKYIVVTCSSVQILICVCWMSIWPPYREYEMTLYASRIIIQCNEGSDIWFYSMLGYLGFLSVISFVLAFMVRTLPDSFNEAKYITFSMLVFCSVWIAMIPAYLSSKGRYMVAMEIFAILASNAGLLCIIFFPKCYIILIKPNVNVRRNG